MPPMPPVPMSVIESNRECGAHLSGSLVVLYFFGGGTPRSKGSSPKW